MNRFIHVLLCATCLFVTQDSVFGAAPAKDRMSNSAGKS